MSFRNLVGARFTALYGPPQTTDANLFIAEWERVFDGMDPEILSAAVSRVIDKRTFQSWPTIGELREAVEEMSEKIGADRARKRLRLAPPQREPTPKERARVAKLMAGLVRELKVS